MQPQIDPNVREGDQVIMTDSSTEKKPPTLSQVVGETAALVQTIIENGGELTPELEAQLETSNIVLAGKLDAYGYVWERLDGEEDYWKAKADTFLRIAKSCKRVRDSLKERMKYAMIELGNQEMSGEDFRFKLQKTSGRLVIENEDALPVELLDEVVTLVPKKAEIKKIITDGGSVSGAEVIMEPSLRKYAAKSKALKGKK